MKKASGKSWKNVNNYSVIELFCKLASYFTLLEAGANGCLFHLFSKAETSSFFSRGGKLSIRRLQSP